MGLRRRYARGASQAKVLVVDPRGEDLEHSSRVLREAGLRVVSLSRLEASAPVFNVFQPDVVLLAVGAPEAPALKVGQRLRHLSRGTVPIFYLVESSDPALRRLCLEKGRGIDALVKPADPPELVAKVKALLSLKQAVTHAEHGDATVPVLHDAVTGAFNRPLLISAIAQEIRRAERYGGDFSIVSCGLRGHESFRRAFGAELADRLVVYVSMVLSQTVREADVIARVGDDSFAVLLPGTPAEQLPPLIARLASRFELARFQVDGKTVRVPIALGHVSFPDTVGTAPRLLEAALEALGRAPVTRERHPAPRLAL